MEKIHGVYKVLSQSKKKVLQKRWAVGEVVEDVAVGAEGLRLDSRAGQIVYCRRRYHVSLELYCPGAKPRR